MKEESKHLEVSAAHPLPHSVYPRSRETTPSHDIRVAFSSDISEHLSQWEATEILDFLCVDLSVSIKIPSQGLAEVRGGRKVFEHAMAFHLESSE